MNYLRTPDERFDNLPDYPFVPNYVDVGGLRMHYVEEGTNEEEIVLMLHGEPSWSYLYRKMIPIVAAAGFRAIAPDLIGFGRSDKPTTFGDYSYQRHVDWVFSLVQQLDLTNVTLFCQDWGGLIGLRIAAEHPDRFKRIIVANTFLPTGDHKPNTAFLKWQAFSQKVPVFDVGNILQMATTTMLSDDVIAAYNAPFPDETYKAGARIFPALVPTSPDDPAAPANRKAWEVLKRWEKPFLTAFSDKDPIMAGIDKIFQKLVPGTKGQPHTTIVDGGHFLQEDKGEELGKLIVDFIHHT